MSMLYQSCKVTGLVMLPARKDSMSEKHKTAESFKKELQDMVKKKRSLEDRFNALHTFVKGHLGLDVLREFYQQYEKDRDTRV